MTSLLNRLQTPSTNAETAPTMPTEGGAEVSSETPIDTFANLMKIEAASTVSQPSQDVIALLPAAARSSFPLKVGNDLATQPIDPTEPETEAVKNQPAATSERVILKTSNVELALQIELGPLVNITLPSSTSELEGKAHHLTKFEDER